MTAPDYAFGTFRTLWTQSGGVMDGEMRMETLPASARPLYEHDSMALSEVIRLVNKYSNNVMARHLMLTLGVEKYGPPATVEERAATPFVCGCRITASRCQGWCSTMAPACRAPSE